MGFTDILYQHGVSGASATLVAFFVKIYWNKISNLEKECERLQESNIKNNEKFITMITYDEHERKSKEMIYELKEFIRNEINHIKELFKRDE